MGKEKVISYGDFCVLCDCGLQFLVIQSLVAEIDGEIHAHENEIDEINRQYVGEIVADDLRGDSRNVACHDEQNKCDAHSFCGVRFDVSVDIQRPR